MFFEITLPLAWPGILAGTVLAFTRAMGEFGATITFAGNIAGQTRTLPLAIFSYSQRVGGEALRAAPALDLRHPGGGRHRRQRVVRLAHAPQAAELSGCS